MSGVILVNELNAVLIRCNQLLVSPNSASIHECRKNLKMFRALIRLLKYAISRELFSELNLEARNISRFLAEFRDYDSALEACDRNYAHLTSYHKNLNTRVKHKILKIQQNNHFNLNKVAEFSSNGIGKLVWFIDQIIPETISLKAITDAYLKMYKKNKQYVLRLTIENTVDEFHEWRKQVKYLRYQVMFLSSAWPSYSFFLENELHILSDFLGNMQDNQLVNDLIVHNKLLKSNAHELFYVSILKMNQSLKQDALNLAKRVFASSAKAEHVKLFDELR